MLQKLSIAVTTCLFSLFIAQASVAQQAEAPKKTTNQLATEAMSEMLNIFNAAAKANSPDSARAAATQINAHTVNLTTLTPLLAKSKKPTETEMRKFAEFVLKNNTQIKTALKRIAVLKESNTPETNSIIKTAMDSMSSKTRPLTTAINRLYPTKKMKAYIQQAKKKQAQ